MKKWTKILLGSIAVLSFAGLGLGIKDCQDKRKSNSSDSGIKKDKISSINEWTENVPNVNTKKINITLPEKLFDFQNLDWFYGREYQIHQMPDITQDEVDNLLQQRKQDLIEKIKERLTNFLENNLQIKATYWNWSNQLNSIVENLWEKYFYGNSVAWENLWKLIKTRETQTHGPRGRTWTWYKRKFTRLYYNNPIEFNLTMKIRSEFEALDEFKKQLSTFITKKQNVTLPTDYNRDTIDDYKRTESEYELFKTNKDYFLERAKKRDEL